MFDVVAGGELVVTEDHRVDREGAFRRGWRFGGQLLPVLVPLRDRPGVLLVALRGAEWPQVVVLAVDGDNGAVPGFVEAVKWGTLDFWHGAAPRWERRYMYRLS